MTGVANEKGIILIVDDTPASLGILFELLSDSGFKVLVAENGESALNKVKYALPDLILLDVLMPGIDGFETCRRLRTSPPTQDIPVIFMTALSETVDKVRGLSFGAVDYITKPLDAEEVLARVTVHLSLRYMTKRLKEQNERLEQEIKERDRAESTLRKLTLELERRVEERTAAISDSNQLLAQSNQMLQQEIAERLQAEAQLERSRSSLQTKAKLLEQALSELQRTQSQIIQSEKMSALGQLIAGVAHEVNNPVGAIRSSVVNISEFLTENLKKLPEFFQGLSRERQHDFFALLQKSAQQTPSLSSKEKRQFKRDLQHQLELQSIENADTLASTLVNIGVYDNIQPFLPLLQDPQSENILKTAYQFATVQRSTITIAAATEKATKIVSALKIYARYDHSGLKVQANIIEGIETVLILYQNQIKHGVEVIKHYGESPSIWCYPDELNQVWTNLIHNALQAMNNNGTLTIDVTQQTANLLVSITDNGKGIPPEIMPRIFEPFFTTKPAGEGSGLGLDIVKNIVAKHQGKIEVSSKPGKTIFTVLLPINLNEETSDV
ncbi:response regulator [Nostoc sp. FACHB-133]|uniref:hybrid sensor histidine kinase/response regulator n=1 Tax=Nostoc sp. FACHB-133 TaxID=2692835 RepID=UPI0016840B5F|nr:response regulator [Nostoc sp. FACHB-133]MBD2527607.1 response regulator [Nostoc sp. FACHB-133]